jgi:phospholipid/cholesterol/gamma-HCH transport system substrate-binding protein
MSTRAPNIKQVGIAVAFAFSCFGLLLFLWTTFGGPVPLAPEGYRVKVPLKEAQQVAVESDVRISNVSVGKVKDLELRDDGFALATIEIDSRYAPLPADTRATQRQKTLLGETYIELSQGSEESETLEEGGTLPTAQVSEAVQLDEIFRTFDSRTRAAFQTWMQQAAIAVKGRGRDLSAAIGNLEPFARDANRLLRILDTQDQAVSQLVNNTGVVFEALSERRGQLRGLIQNAEAVFSTTARRDEDLKAAFRALPTFLDESRLTLTRLEEFAEDTDPVVVQLRPAARELGGTLRQVARVAPDLRGFFAGFRLLARRSQTGLPAIQALLNTDLPPLLTALQPFLRQLNPIVDALGRYRREVTSFLGNVTAATNAAGVAPETGEATNYLRTAATVSPESVAVFPDHRLQVNRTNAYVEPGGGLNVPFLSFETRHCGGPPGVVATLDPTTPTNPAWIPRATYDTPEFLFELLKTNAFNDVNNLSSNSVAAPPCQKQPPQPSIGEVPELTDYLHVYQAAP